MPENILENKKVVQPEGGWTKHAPAGGIAINGKFFSGGVFIPNEDMEKSSEEERKELAERQELIKKYGSKNVKKMLDSGQLSKTKEKDDAEQDIAKPDVHIRENVYIIDDGSILGGDSYGSFIIKKGKLIDEDLNILNALQTKRIDCILGEEITSYKNPEGIWDKGKTPETENMNKDSYTVLNNLSEPIKDYFFKTQDKPIYRMSLVNPTFKHLWRVEHDGKEKLLYIDKSEDIMLWHSLNEYIKHTKTIGSGKLKKTEDGVIAEMPERYAEITDFNNPAEVLLKDVLMGGDGDPSKFKTDGKYIFKIKMELPMGTDIKNLDISRFIFSPYFKVTKKDLKEVLQGITIHRKDLEKILNDIKYPDKDLFLDSFLERFYNIGKYLE